VEDSRIETIRENITITEKLIDDLCENPTLGKKEELKRYVAEQIKIWSGLDEVENPEKYLEMERLVSNTQ